MPKGVYDRTRRRRRLSPEVLETHAFIAKYIFDNGMPPTVREIAAGRFLSVAAVGRHLARLDERDIIELVPGKARGIRLLVYKRK